MSNKQCQDEGLLLPIKLRINQVSPHKNAAILCCAQDGCNWNYTTTFYNYSYDKILSMEPNNGSNNTSTLSSGFSDAGYIALILILLIVLLILFCICCLFGFKKKRKQEEIDDQHGLKPPTADSLEDIPVTPVRNINHVNVQNYSRDHERYSAVDKKIYKRDIEPYKAGLSDYKYHPSENSSGYNSAYSGADPLTAYGGNSKNRIASVSKSVFDTEDYHKANNAINPANNEDQLRGGAKNWHNVWKVATSSSETSRNRVNKKKETAAAAESYANPFRLNSS